MTTPYALTYTPSMDLLGRAMTSWARPRPAIFQRLIGFIGCILLGAAIGVLTAFLDVADTVRNALLLGFFVGSMAGLIFWLTSYKRDMRRVQDAIAKLLTRQGATHARFSPDGVTFRTDLGQATSSLAAFDLIIVTTDATALKSGGMVYPVPDAALPGGVTPEAFRADLQRWLEAAG